MDAKSKAKKHQRVEVSPVANPVVILRADPPSKQQAQPKKAEKKAKKKAKKEENKEPTDPKKEEKVETGQPQVVDLTS